MSGHFPDDGQELAEATLATKIAIMATNGTPVITIAKEMGCSAGKIRRILNTDECIAAIRKIEKECLSTATAIVKVGMAKFAKETLQALQELIEERNPQGVAMGLKILQVLTDQPKEEASTSITVIMPGVDTSSPINVTPAKVPNDNS